MPSTNTLAYFVAPLFDGGKKRFKTLTLSQVFSVVVNGNDEHVSVH
jgi:hypothetical protein